MVLLTLAQRNEELWQKLPTAVGRSEDDGSSIRFAGKLNPTKWRQGIMIIKSLMP